MKFLRIILKLSLSLLALLSLIFILVWFNLASILTPAFLEESQSYFLPNVKVDWDKIDIKFINLGVLNKKVTMRGVDFCVKSKAFNICTDNLDVHLTIRPINRRMIELNALQYSGNRSRLEIDQTSMAEDEPLNLQKIKQQVLDGLAFLRKNAQRLPAQFNLVLKDFEIIQNSKSWLVGVSIDSQEFSAIIDNGLLQAKSSGKFHPTLQSLHKLDGTVLLTNSDAVIETKYVLLLGDHAQIKTKTNMQFSLSKEKKEEKRNIASFNLNINLLSDRDEIIIDTLEAQLEPYFSYVNIKKCTVDYSQDSDFLLKANCPQTKISLGRNLEKQKAELSKMSASTDILLKFSAGIRHSLVNGRSGTVGHLDINLDTYKSDFLVVDANSFISFVRTSSQLAIVPKSLDIQMVLDSFKKINQLLNSTEHPLPSMINEMEGKSEFNLSLKEVDKGRALFNISGHANLRGPKKQRLNAKLMGDYHYSIFDSKKADTLKLRTVLKDLVVYIPDISPLNGIPDLQRDPRIQVSTENIPSKRHSTANSKKPLEVDFELLTERDDSIRIYYYLARPYVPLGLSLKLKNKQLKYQISMGEPFAIELLKRQIEFESFEIETDDVEQETANLNAKLSYAASNYKIFLNILGTVKEPVLKLTSIPYLPESDIISVLLYNRTRSELNGGENRSVGGAESAIADKALGLFSMWALAATPIRSFSYDSNSNVYKAQVELPGGVDLDIGTDWEESQNIGLRKQIWGNWMLVTGLKSGGKEGQVGNIFLQKEWSY